MIILTIAQRYIQVIIIKIDDCINRRRNQELFAPYPLPNSIEFVRILYASSSDTHIPHYDGKI